MLWQPKDGLCAYTSNLYMWYPQLSILQSVKNLPVYVLPVWYFPPSSWMQIATCKEYSYCFMFIDYPKQALIFVCLKLLDKMIIQQVLSSHIRNLWILTLNFFVMITFCIVTNQVFWILDKNLWNLCLFTCLNIRNQIGRRNSILNSLKILAIKVFCWSKTWKMVLEQDRKEHGTANT